MASLGLLAACGGGRAMSPGKLERVLDPPQAPVGLGGDAATQLAVWRAYYDAYGLWLSRSMLQPEVGVCSGSECERDEPSYNGSVLDSDVSVSSSASSGRAARRARWRRNRARRRASAASELSHGMPEGLVAESRKGDSELTYSPGPSCGDGVVGEPGRCYMAAVVSGKEAEARAALDVDPTFGALLSSPAAWFDCTGLAVSRVAEGRYHVSAVGLVSLVDCLESVMLRAGVEPEPGSLGALVRLQRRAVAPVLVEKAPRITDVCGAAVGGCAHCSVALSYENDGESWSQGFVAVDPRESATRGEYRLAGGAVLAVYDVRGRWAVVPYSTEEDAASAVSLGVLRCSVHGQPLARCRCSSLRADICQVYAHLIDKSAVKEGGCRGRCGERPLSTSRRVAVGAGAVGTFFHTPAWRETNPRAFEGVAAYQALGGFLSGDSL